MIINQFQSVSELSPSYPDWASNFRSLINAFYNNPRVYPKSRLAIATKLAKVYEDITDIDHEELRAEIVEDMVSMWERTLIEEKNEEIVNIAFEVMRKEIILSTMAEEAGSSDEEVVHGKKINWQDIANRIRCLWVKVAATAPPYFEADKFTPMQSPPPFSAGMHSPSVASTPGIDAGYQKGMHSANQSLQVNSTSMSSGDPYNTQSTSGIGEVMEVAMTSSTGASNSQANPMANSPPKTGRAILAVIFLVKSFNKLAFRSPQSLTILLSDASKRQSARAAGMAIELFRNIIQLVGINPPDKVDDIPESQPLHAERLDRARCPKARLVILQWLLRLRADRDHRIYAVGDIDNEVAPLARLIHRARRSSSSASQPQPDRATQSLPTGLAERRRNRAETKSAMDIRAHRPTERNEGKEHTSREHTREPRGRATEALSASASRSRSRPPTSPRTPYSIPRPAEILWCLPEPLKIELERHATRPSPAMATFTSIKGDEGIYWLHVDYYVDTLVSLLEHERDWEVISYILCHLPLQLSNKHFFCGPKTKVQIRKLVLSICNAINGDRLCSNMDVLLPSELVQVDIQALLYNTLTVLISYHRIFDPEIGDYNQKAKSIKSDIVEVIFRGLARDEATNKPCLEALSLAVYELPDQVSKFTAPIVEKLSRIMSNPNMAVHILELLVIIGYTPRLYSGAFREEEYRRVFGVALQYIEHHYRPDAAKLRTADGGESYSLAQHVLNTAFFVIYIWFLAIKLEDRARYVPFITKQLLIANGKKESIEHTTEVCFDWLARYAYSNADPKAASSFLYRSIVAPTAGSFNADQSWDEQHKFEMDNTAGIKAWKLGNSIVTISTMKKPPGWIRIVSRRPSGLTELICRLENWPHVSAGDFDPDLTSIPVTMLAERPTFEESDDSLDIDEVR
jgi:tuberous sclerosis 2